MARADMPIFESAEWRRAMGGFCTGVTIVASRTPDDGLPVGTTVNAFSSVSLTPPLLLVCLDRESATLAVVKRTNVFAVSVLADHQEHLARRFAYDPEDVRFDGVSHQAAVTKSPVIDGAVSWFDCAVHAIHDGGDHEIVVGRVLQLSARADPALVYHRGKFLDVVSEKAKYG